MATENYDVCVFGAGPSGSVIAKKLAQMGYVVVLVEKEKSPGNNIGLSLTPGIHHWLNLLDLKEEVGNAGFIQAFQSNILWENDVVTEKIFNPNSCGYHVDRSKFDEILLQSALKDGVTLMQPCTLNKLDQCKEGNWKVSLTHFTTKKLLTAKFIVEATGRKSIQKGTKKAYLPTTIATYAYWKTAAKKHFSFIEAGKNEWYWGAPVKDGYLACIFSDPKAVKAFSSVQDFYFEKMSKSILFDSLQCKNAGNIMACTATAYKDVNPVSENYLKVGDAALTMDPLSSQGVQKAIKSAYQGAIVVHTLLKKESPYPALEYYHKLIETEVLKNTFWTKQFYNRQKRNVAGEFWNSRKDYSISPSDKVDEGKLSVRKEDKLFINPDAILTKVPVVGESLIEYREGVQIEGNIEPFVFVQNIPVTTLLRAVNGKPLLDGLEAIKTALPDSNPLELLQWLLYHRILCTENSQIKFKNTI
jgi:flavin-dependent dehydrogenase